MIQQSYRVDKYKDLFYYRNLIFSNQMNTLCCFLFGSIGVSLSLFRRFMKRQFDYSFSKSLCKGL